MDEFLELLVLAFCHLWESDWMFRVSAVLLPVYLLWLLVGVLSLEVKK